MYYFSAFHVQENKHLKYWISFLKSTTVRCLKTTEMYYITVLGARSPNARCWPRLFPTGTCRGKPFNASPSSWRQLSTVDIPGLTAAPLHWLPVLPQDIFPLRLHLHMTFLSYYKDTTCTGLWPALMTSS